MTESRSWLTIKGTSVAALLNFAVARRLLDAGNKYRSITLEADAQHLLTDVWTSAGGKPVCASFNLPAIG